jgi:glutathione S-transferase
LPRDKAERRALQGHRGAGSDYCPAHDPARKDARRRAASKAARSKPDAGIKGVKVQLQDLADRVLSSELERADAAVVSQVLNVKLRALDLERKWRELGEVEDRLQALERVLKGRNAG